MPIWRAPSKNIGLRATWIGILPYDFLYISAAVTVSRNRPVNNGNQQVHLINNLFSMQWYNLGPWAYHVTLCRYNYSDCRM